MSLTEAGVLTEDGGLSERGQQLRERVERATNDAAVKPWLHLGDENATRLQQLGRSLSKTAAAAGAFPGDVFVTPKA